jgi:hypothetical protein
MKMFWTTRPSPSVYVSVPREFASVAGVILLACAMRSSPGSDPYASASETPVRVLTRRATTPSSHPLSIAPTAAADTRPGPSLASRAVTQPILVAGSRSRPGNLEAHVADPYR